MAGGLEHLEWTLDGAASDRVGARRPEAPRKRRATPTWEPAAGRRPFVSVTDALEDYAAGRFVLVVDDEDRENEGDLCCAAELVTPAHIAFMARRASGLVCTAMTGERLDELGIGQLVDENTNPHGTAFTVSVEARHLTTTGISAHDRAATIRHLLDPAAVPDDFVRPGHTFPLRADPGGVLTRAGHTEAAVDLARLAGLAPAGVICEIMNDDGTMARRDELTEFAEEHGIKMLTIEELARHRRRTERLVIERAACRLPIGADVWRATAYEDVLTGETHLAIVLGDGRHDAAPLVHAHSCCLTGDVLRSVRCDCRIQLDAALERISQAGHGIVLYLSNDTGRGGGFIDKLKVYEARRGARGLDPDYGTHEALRRGDYRVAASILRDLGAGEIRLLTNNPAGSAELATHGVRVVERMSLRPMPVVEPSARRLELISEMP
ncbi:MAG: 3,4-dihydroxy 2-butanone 4-phosphate synthase / cyclohydrolase [Solirubrobacteraceae bacterium]|jgi:3,4-dihydroxy 2-butanone 4-phosphate synthase/GTP cyclohydrolase II|nr:3,4-dihydroxy 2-butanone 4-phosphate synthase / cyclohydrolase [Solirubrobacteraceae bacterium]